MNESQQTFLLEGGAPSQADIILEYLQAHRGEEVPMPKLYGISGAFAVHSRICDLRARGHKIVNRVDNSSRPHKSFYTLTA